MSVSNAGSTGIAAILPVVTIPIFLAISNQTMISVALPAIGTEFLELSRLPWVIIGYLVALTIAAPVSGALGDMFGRKTMLITALCVFITGAIMCALATSIEFLTIGRLVQGLGGGGLMALSQALIGQMVQGRDRGKAQGYVATIAVVASTLGPLLTGLFLDIVGWRSLFLVTVPLSLVAIYLLWRIDVPKTDSGRRGFDMIGLILLSALVLGWVASMEMLKYPVNLNMFAKISVFSVLITIGMFIWQRRSPYPLFPPRMFQLPAVAAANLMVFFHGSGIAHNGTFDTELPNLPYFTVKQESERWPTQS